MATAEKLTDVDLSSIQLHETKPRALAKESLHTGIVQEDDIETAFGPLHVCVQGERGKPPIFTYHDIGLNSGTCFQGFFNFEDMQPILKHFTVYHVNAPGQHEGAPPLPHGGMQTSESDTLLETMAKSETEAAKRASYTYPTMDQLAEMLMPVMQYYGLKTFIGFGVGAGANVLSRFALNHPDKIDGLCLINCSSSRPSWTEWGYQKLNSWYLKGGHISAATEDYLLWHWFGKKTMNENTDLVQVFTEYVHSINAANLAYFIESYVKRTDLGLIREYDPQLQKEVRNFRCPVMLVGGEASPHLNQVVHMNGQLDPAESTWMKFECGGMVQEEAPDKLCESFRLFLQGMGYIPTLSKMSLARQASLASTGRSSVTSVGAAESLRHHHHHKGANRRQASAPGPEYQAQTAC